jgi:hypothetical protein
MRGYPNERGMAKVSSGLAVLGGCAVEPGQPDYSCPRGHQWSGGGRLPEGADGAARMYAAGDLDGAAGAYAEAVAASVQARGERDRETRVLRHALTLVLSAAGRDEEAAAAYAPARAIEYEETKARIEERYRRYTEGS